MRGAFGRSCRGSSWVSSWVVAACLAALGCSAPSAETLLIDVQESGRIAGRFLSEERAIDFWSTSSGPLSGDVRAQSGALTYDVHYDFDERDDDELNDDERAVIADGYGRALDRGTQADLLLAIEALTSYLGRTQPDLPLQEQMLYAGLSLLRDSGGIPLERKTFALGPKDPSGRAEEAGSDALEVEKSLGDDGTRCVKNGLWYYVSFNYGDTTVIDAEEQAGVFECNGQCGPTCTQLQPWKMWTLDCLEHDSCCNTTSDDTCWTPLGECGDEYDSAMGDFLRGFDPFRKHCGG